MEFLHQSQLPFLGMSHEFVGADRGTSVSFFLVIAKPGGATRIHKHDYDKIVYVIAGRAKWIVGNEEREAAAGDVIVVRAGEPHRFISADDDPVRQIDIHLNRTFETAWLEEVNGDPPSGG